MLNLKVYICKKNTKLTKNIIDETFFEKLNDYILNENHTYYSTHTKLCYFIVYRIYKRVLDGYGNKFGGIKIDVNNNLIIDGNHRYLAYKLANFKFQIIKGTKNHSDNFNKINNINIDINEDWDYNCKINRKYCDDKFLEDL